LIYHTGIEVVDDVSECDYVVMRKTYTSNDPVLNIRVCEELNAYSDGHGKQFVYFLHDDPDGDMGECVEGGIIFRTSYNRSMGRINEYCMPSFFPEDLGMDMMRVIDDVVVPSVGFCGNVSHQVRLDAYNALMRRGVIKLNVVFRDHLHYVCSFTEIKRNRKEFLDVMGGSVYQLCCRGGGNFSHRFYETLASGRIPVLIDTDIPLPDIGEDWNNYIVMVTDVNKLVNKLMEWHNNHDVVDMQVRCRRLWEDRLSFKGFSKTVGNILLNNLKKN
jgi:hypothetical protein